MSDSEPKSEVLAAGQGKAEVPHLPGTPLPAIDKATRLALEAAAMAANERYLTEIIEGHSFCPFSRGGRAQGQTARYVHYQDETDCEAILQRLVQAASTPHIVVLQIIMPLLEISPKGWIEFCRKITDAGNARLGGKGDVFAVAPLHPALPYKTNTPYTLIPLLRRSPDPTIQWVRQDGLDALYEGRTGDTTFVDSHNIAAFLEQKHAPPLFERIAETNMAMANHLGIERLEKDLAEISTTARKRYTSVLLSEGKASPAATAPCLHSGSSAVQLKRPPLQAVADGEHWRLLPLRQLKQREPQHIQVDDVDLVVLKTGGETHVLYGRCPHRMALLSEALVETTRLVCRHHGWDFDLHSGKSDGVPGESVYRFSPYIQEGQVCITDKEIRQWRILHPQAFQLGELEV